MGEITLKIKDEDEERLEKFLERSSKDISKEEAIAAAIENWVDET